MNMKLTFVKSLFLLVAIISTAGCAGHFEEARLVGLKASPKVQVDATDPRDYCRKLDGKRRTAETAALVIDSVAGTALISSLALIIQDEKWAGVATGIGTAVLTGAGVGTHFLAKDYAEQYIEEGCAK